uniref:B30.2/SPRY domain-containing protein n=1 Tax=Astyanax mexicanus TaxID=7994 RepID=A0A8B9LEV5_ASTMX
NEKIKESGEKLFCLIEISVDVTLDPDTAHPNLILSDDAKQVTHGNTKQKLSDNKERFNTCVCVLGKEGFSSGRFYYEVQVREKYEWDLGVVRGSVNRKGEIILNPQDGFWTVVLRNGNEFSACTNPSTSVKEKPQKVGVFVDYEEGLVSFYDVEASYNIYYFTGQSFTEKLYSYICPCINDEGNKCSSTDHHTCVEDLMQSFLTTYRALRICC